MLPNGPYGIENPRVGGSIPSLGTEKAAFIAAFCVKAFGAGCLLRPICLWFSPSFITLNITAGEDRLVEGRHLATTEQDLEHLGGRLQPALCVCGLGARDAHALSVGVHVRGRDPTQLGVACAEAAECRRWSPSRSVHVVSMCRLKPVVVGALYRHWAELSQLGRSARRA